MSELKEAIYETAKGLYKAGGLSLTTMLEIESLCVPAADKEILSQPNHTTQSKE